mgnify:CR=1 FL=1
MAFSINSIVTGIIESVLQVFYWTWWFIVPIVLAFIFWELWLFYIRENYKKNIKWVLLRIKTPKEILKTPKTMEQIFATAFGVYSFGMKPYEIYWDGKVEAWLSFELVGYAGGVYFYIRIAEGFRNMIESAIYAQYPEAEIEVVDDYIDLLPNVLPNDIYDVFGTDYVLIKPDAYPLRTYPYFEALVSEEKVDTMANLTEALSRLKADETVWIQILIRPILSKDWAPKAQEEINKLIGRKQPPLQPNAFLFETGVFIKNLLLAIFQEPTWPTLEKPKEEKVSLAQFTKGEQDVIRGIENKMSKLAFETTIRFLYIDRKDKFSRGNVASIFGTFFQLNDERSNSLKPNTAIMTSVAKQPFKKQRVYYKKRQIYDRYRLRKMPHRVFILNTEELATIYHFPSTVVEAPMLRRAESKKGEPPLSLPVE